MKKYLCLSLCLSIMTSACRSDTKQNLDDAYAGRAGDTQLTTSLTKQKVLEACLPQINALLIAYYSFSAESGIARDNANLPDAAKKNFYLRRAARFNATVETPIVVLYTSHGMPLYFSGATTTGLGPTAAAVKANLKAMAASPVIQHQFVEREKVDGVAPPGYRIYISMEAIDQDIPAANAGTKPVSPLPNKLIIYDPESIAAANVEVPKVVGNHFIREDELGGWYDCDVNEKTQRVTAYYTAAVVR